MVLKGVVWLSMLSSRGTQSSYRGRDSSKEHSNNELRRLYDAATQHYWVLKAAKSDSFEMVLTVILKQNLDQKTRLKWTKFNSDSKKCSTVYGISQTLKTPCESVSHTAHKQSSGLDWKVPVKKFLPLSRDDTSLDGQRLSSYMCERTGCYSIPRFVLVKPDVIIMNKINLRGVT